MKTEKLMESLSARLGPKYCKDCKWVRPTSWCDASGWGNRYRFAKCANPRAQMTSNNDYLVDGENGTAYCSIARLDWNCGKAGKFWEAK